MLKNIPQKLIFDFNEYLLESNLEFIFKLDIRLGYPLKC